MEPQAILVLFGDTNSDVKKHQLASPAIPKFEIHLVWTPQGSLPVSNLMCSPAAGQASHAFPSRSRYCHVIKVEFLKPHVCSLSHNWTLTKVINIVDPVIPSLHAMQTQASYQKSRSQNTRMIYCVLGLRKSLYARPISDCLLRTASGMAGHCTQ